MLVSILLFYSPLHLSQQGPKHEKSAIVYYKQYEEVYKYVASVIDNGYEITYSKDYVG